MITLKTIIIMKTIWCCLLILPLSDFSLPYFTLRHLFLTIIYIYIYIYHIYNYKTVKLFTVYVIHRFKVPLKTGHLFIHHNQNIFQHKDSMHVYSVSSLSGCKDSFDIVYSLPSYHSSHTFYRAAWANCDSLGIFWRFLF